MTGTSAVIVGAGPGLSASLARQLSARGFDITLAARDTEKLSALASETGARTVAMDATDPAAMAALFDGLPSPVEVAIYNPSARVRGALVDLDPEKVRRAIEVTAYGAFLMAQCAAERMLARAGTVKGTILFTGASAGVKGFANSAPFAMGKFAQRGLAQAMARELHPKGVHVAWINIDGAIRSDARPDDGNDARLDPEAIARAYLGLIDQHCSAWSDELTLRPWVETF